ncbi:hypothetical protein CASFOL_019822 [Castilleja foliolosa]|uniref:Uncharacterized protein n=1 Tax=Castilleja foliolosa TaxID=1961234 RepID=A0ABD3D2U8_9LAMI
MDQALIPNSHFKQGHLLSGSVDAYICLWDINATPENKALDGMRKFKANEGTVEDVAWHMKNEYLFGSVGEDKFMHIWDLRSPSVTKSVEAHERKVKCLSFNPLNDWAIATGSVDKTVRLFDIRSFSKPFHIFESHTEEIVQVGWNPKNETILASSCLGQRLMIWDYSRIGDEQTEEDAKYRPPELFFIHSGHSSTVRDFSWNPCEDWVMASVSDDNVLQIWQIADFVLQIT